VDIKQLCAAIRRKLSIGNCYEQLFLGSDYFIPSCKRNSRTSKQQFRHRLFEVEHVLEQCYCVYYRECIHVQEGYEFDSKTAELGSYNHIYRDWVVVHKFLYDCFSLKFC